MRLTTCALAARQGASRPPWYLRRRLLRVSTPLALPDLLGDPANTWDHDYVFARQF
jgi:hypothetical protein